MLVRRHPQLPGYTFGEPSPEYDPGWGVDVNAFAEVKAFFRDTQLLKRYYQKLSARVHEFVLSGASINRALDRALHETESLWMNPGRIKITEEDQSGNTYVMFQNWDPSAKGGRGKWVTDDKRTVTVPTRQQGLSPHDFTGHVLRHRQAFKDVGAPKPHGEYAHRIQWYCIYHHFVGGGSCDLDDMDDMWDVLAHQTFICPNVVGTLVSMWDSVLDIRGTWSRGEHDPKPTEEVRLHLLRDYEGTQHAVAVHVTGSLSWTGAGQNLRRGELVDDTTLHLSTAVGKRRLKRTRGLKSGDELEQGYQSHLKKLQTS